MENYRTVIKTETKGYIFLYFTIKKPKARNYRAEQNKIKNQRKFRAKFIGNCWQFILHTEKINLKK